MKNKIIGLLIVIATLVFTLLTTTSYTDNMVSAIIHDTMVIFLLTYGLTMIQREASKTGFLNIFILHMVTIIYAPITLFRLLVSIIIKLDMWCDSVIDEVIKK